VGKPDTNEISSSTALPAARRAVRGPRLAAAAAAAAAPRLYRPASAAPRSFPLLPPPAGRLVGGLARLLPARPCARMAAPGPQQLPHGAMLAAARDYVEKSNRGEVPACLSMFAADAVYGSSTVGGHEGLEAITAMMTGFFGKFPAVHWQVEEYLVSKVSWRC
jgi:hypothetical protein